MSDVQCPVWQRLLDQAMAKQLTPAEEEAQLLAGLNYQVQNGGFSQWVVNGYAQDGKGQATHKLLKKMADRFPCAGNVVGMVAIVLKLVDEDQPDRGCFGEYLKTDKFEDLDDAFENLRIVTGPLDTDYYAMNDAFMAEVEEYLRVLEDSLTKKVAK